MLRPFFAVITVQGLLFLTWNVAAQEALEVAARY